MARRMLMGIMAAVALSGVAAGAAAERVIGRVMTVTDRSVQIATTSRKTMSVSVDDQTRYMKWITHQPWQQDNRADQRSVVVGSCVEIELRDAGLAHIVRINTDNAGTPYDPCDTIR